MRSDPTGLTSFTLNFEFDLTHFDELNERESITGGLSERKSITIILVPELVEGRLNRIRITMERTYRLVVSCPDRTGIVAKVSNFLATYNGWITEASYHADQKNGWFFMRNEIKATSLPFRV